MKGLTFLIFDRQKNYFEFYMENPDDTKLSCLISAGVNLEISLDICVDIFVHFVQVEPIQ